MRKGKKRMITMLTSLLLLAQTMPVMAAEKQAVILKAKQNSNEKQIEVICGTEQGNEITNGKLRIFYDEDKVELISSEVGDALDGGMCEINDCLTGNKPEGELVAAFASSTNLKEEGSLLNLKFQLKSGVEKDSEVLFQVKPEKLAGEGGDVSVKEVKLNYVVGKTGEQSGSDNGNSNSQVDTGKKGDSIKTGDKAGIFKYAALGGGTFLVILGCAAISIAKKRTEHF